MLYRLHGISGRGQAAGQDCGRNMAYLTLPGPLQMSSKGVGWCEGREGSPGENCLWVGKPHFQWAWGGACRVVWIQLRGRSWRDLLL